MAQRKRRRRARSQKPQYPPFVWVLFGLAIGLSVAVAVYVKDRADRSYAVRAAAAG